MSDMLPLHWREVWNDAMISDLIRLGRERYGLDLEDITALVDEMQVREAARPEPVCDRCGNPDEFDHLVEVIIMMAPGEEGDSMVTKAVCDVCLVDVQDAIKALGFTLHKHGGACFLEDTTCPGSHDPKLCPTPHQDEEN